MRMRELVTGVNQLVTRVRDAQSKMRNAPTADNEMPAKVSALAAKLLTEPVRYGSRGQAHITYLASMTANVDQKIGREAIERYAVLKKSLMQSARKLIGCSDWQRGQQRPQLTGRSIRRLRRLTDKN